MWLLSNNIHKKNSKWLGRSNARVSRNHSKIAPSRARICLAISEFLCSLTNPNAWFVSSFCNELPLFCSVSPENCISLSQSEWRNFPMYIIRHGNNHLDFPGMQSNEPMNQWNSKHLEYIISGGTSGNSQRVCTKKMLANHWVKPVTVVKTHWTSLYSFIAIIFKMVIVLSY